MLARLRNLSVLIALLLVADYAFAKAGAGRALVNEGTIEFGIAGKWDLDPDDETLSYLDLKLGYYILDGHEVGLQTLNGVNELGYRDRKGLFYEWTFANGSQFLPYAGFAAMHAAPVNDSEDGKDARYSSSFGGAKFVMSTSVAITLQYQYEVSLAGKVFGPPGDRKARNREINMGFRLYW